MKLSDFHIRVFGKEGARWIIFLHGLLGSSQNWGKITPAFESDYRILTFDQRGHGRSFQPEDGYALTNFSKDLKFIFSELNIPQASLVGHSMGGRVAMLFASQNPEKIGKLVIEDIGPESSVENGAKLIATLKDIPAPFATRAAMQEFFTKDFYDRKLGVFLATNMVMLPDNSVNWGRDLAGIFSIIDEGRNKNLWPEFQAITSPILVIRGEKSTDLSEEVYLRMLRQPNVRGTVIKNASHWVHAEQPSEFTENLKKFLYYP